MTPTSRRALVLAAPALLLPAAARAQAGWPDRPVRWINPGPAGGAGDVLSRLVADRISARIGQRRAQRFDVRAAHQAADVLHLTALGFVRPRHALCFADGASQILGYVDTFDLVGRQRNQFLAERLQFLHRLFAPGLR